MRFDISGLSNRLGLEEIHRVFNGILLGEGDVGIQGHDLAAFIHIAQGKIAFGVGICGEGIDTVERIQTGCHTRGTADVIIRSTEIDDVCICIADECAGFLRDGDDVRRGDDILLVVQVNLADCGDIRLHKSNGGGEFDGDIGMTAQVLDEPGFVLVGDEHARAVHRADGVVNGGQQRNAFLSGCRLTEQNGRDFGFLNAVIRIRIDRKDLILAAQRFGCGDH